MVTNLIAIDHVVDSRASVDKSSSVCRMARNCSTKLRRRCYRIRRCVRSFFLSFTMHQVIFHVKIKGEHDNSWNEELSRALSADQCAAISRRNVDQSSTLSRQIINTTRPPKLQINFSASFVSLYIVRRKSERHRAFLRDIIHVNYAPIICRS